MIGTTKGTDPMNGKEFAQAFFDAFQVHVVSYNIRVEHNHHPLNVMGQMSPVSYVAGPQIATVEVTCILPSAPDSCKSLISEFDLGSRENCLTSVSHRFEQHQNRVELVYKVYNLEKFFSDVRNLGYKKFSDEFHKQLDEILDTPSSD